MKEHVLYIKFTPRGISYSPPIPSISLLFTQPPSASFSSKKSSSGGSSVSVTWSSVAGKT